MNGQAIQLRAPPGRFLSHATGSSGAADPVLAPRRHPDVRRALLRRGRSGAASGIQSPLALPTSGRRGRRRQCRNCAVWQRALRALAFLQEVPIRRLAFAMEPDHRSIAEEDFVAARKAALGAGSIDVVSGRPLGPVLGASSTESVRSFFFSRKSATPSGMSIHDNVPPLPSTAVAPASAAQLSAAPIPRLGGPHHVQAAAVCASPRRGACRVAWCRSRAPCAIAPRPPAPACAALSIISSCCCSPACFLPPCFGPCRRVQPRPLGAPRPSQVDRRGLLRFCRLGRA